MEDQECDINNNIRQIYSDFMLKIAKFEELVSQGTKLILDFQHGIHFLRRHHFEKMSALVGDIVKSNETERLSSYLQKGGFKVHDTTQNERMMNLSYSRLKDYPSQGKSIVDQLEGFIHRATIEMKAATQNLYSDDKVFSEEMQVSDQKCDDADYAATMAILCSMIKQDFRMQEQIVASLSLISSSEELESYSFMWSLRPFIDEDIMLAAWKLVP